MADENNNIPVDNDDEPKNEQANTTPETPETPDTPPASDSDVDMDNRLERLGGEPAPVITPEEFSRLQKAGQVHIDSRGQVRSAGRSGPNTGVSLRKRRAWYGK